MTIYCMYVDSMLNDNDYLCWIYFVMTMTIYCMYVESILNDNDYLRWYYYYFYGYRKQDYLETDGTSDSTNILVPWRPVVLGAYAKAVSERGESGGASFDE